jgi:hypothetical protein
VNEFTSMRVGLDGSMAPEVWYAAVMPPRWGTSIVFVFGILVLWVGRGERVWIPFLRLLLYWGCYRKLLVSRRGWGKRG